MVIILPTNARCLIVKYSSKFLILYKLYRLIMVACYFGITIEVVIANLLITPVGEDR